MCRNKSSRNVLKIYEDFFWNKIKIPAQRSTGGGVLVDHKPTGRGHPPRSRHEGLWGPRGTTAPKLSSTSSVSPGKKSEKWFHRVLRYGGAATSCSSSGGQIRSPFGAPERGNRRHRHHQPSSIDNSMMLPEKNQRNGFIAFYDTEAPPPPVLHLEGRSGVRSGLRRGEIVVIVIINLPPSTIP